jgi:SAM-dependent methyltransferase
MLSRPYLSISPGSIDFRRRAQLTERMDEPCARDDLRACLRDIVRLNRWFLGDRSLFGWLDTFISPSMPQPLRILDVGCGNGDALRRIARWAGAHRLAVELTGLDINPDAIAIAAEATPPTLQIEWVASGIFTYTPAEPIHLVVSSLFTHHLGDSEIIRFLEWMEQYAALGWFINDLSRAAVPYHFLRVFTRLARLHPFVQYDAPASVARAFVPQDWQKLCAAASLSERDFSIQPFAPARLCVARRKTP